MKPINRYIRFLFFSYPTALFFEWIANTLGDGILFKQEQWPVFFVAWYGALYSILYLFFKKFGLLYACLFFAVLGSVVEIVLFKRSHLIVDPIVYAFMAFVPCWADKKFRVT